MGFKKDLSKFKPRKEQTDALEYIDTQYKDNPNNKFFLLDLPVGTGKSHLTMMITDWYRKTVRGDTRVDVITNSKILQNQYSDTYESIADLKGKENYQCKSYACSCLQGAEFSKLNKTKCDYCPHSTARERFITGGISLTNFYLFILYSMYNEKVMESRSSSVLIVDESHQFDDVMSNFITIKITDRIIKKFKFTKERTMISRLKSIRNIDQYVVFLEYFAGEIGGAIKSMERTLSSVNRNPKKDNRNLKLAKILDSKNPDLKIMKLMTDLKQLNTKIEIFLKEYKDNPDNWILETPYNERTKQKELSLEPIWAYDYLDKYIFSKYDMVFLMSGTILNKELFCELNGLDVNRACYYSIPSPFNPKSRPIIYMPIGKMTYTKKQQTFKTYVVYIKKLLEKYKGKKGIIHTNSFELQKWIENEIKNPRLVFHDSSNKDEVLKMHMESKKDTVIVSPSMGTGVSFDDDAARFQIIAKIPYPSLASKKNKLRQRQKPEWYSWMTSALLQQAAGRIVRSRLDYGDTIIIDSSFGDVLRYSSHFIPQWFQNAIKTINVKR
mgnify:CR=1 FL=1